jgi:hypothetical protein
MLQIIKSVATANVAAQIRLSYFVDGKPVNKTVEFSKDLYDALLEQADLVNELKPDNFLQDYANIIARVEGMISVTPATTTLRAGNFVEIKGDYFMVIKGVTTRIPVPEAFIKLYEIKAEESVRNAESLLKFWIRFMRNPTLRTRSKSEVKRFAANLVEYISSTVRDHDYYKQLLEEGYSEEKAGVMSMVEEVKITREGLLQTYKVVNPLWNRMTHKYILNENGNVSSTLRDGFTYEVNEDTGAKTLVGVESLKNEDYIFEPKIMHQSGDEFYCGTTKGHDVKVGNVVRLETWGQVNTQLNLTCVKGLHLGGRSYIAGYETVGTETLNCLIDPMNIGYCGGKSVEVLRVIEYYVLSIKDREANNKGFYSSSTYAGMSDAEWTKFKEAVVESDMKALEEMQKQVMKDAQELDALS